MTRIKALTLAGVPESLHSEAIATQAGHTLPPGTIAALFNAIDVTELDPWAAMARLGVQIVQVPE